MIKPLMKKYAASLESKGQELKAVQWYQKAGEIERAGDILFDLGDYSGAIDLFVTAKKFDKAAEAALKKSDNTAAADFFLQAGETMKALKALVDSGNVQRAMSIIEEQSIKKEAALMFEEIGKSNIAAQLYTEINDFTKAIQLYRATKNWNKLLDTYTKTGDLEAAAEDCLEKGESSLAAVLYEMNQQYANAAQIYVASGMTDKAIELFEKAGDFDSIAEIHMDNGNLYLAAETYQKIPAQINTAAELYEKLIILQDVDRHTFDKNVQCGCVALNANAAVLGTTDRCILFTDTGLQQKWRFRLSGQRNPRIISMTPDGKLFAVGTEGPQGSDANSLLMINDVKAELAHISFDEPPKDIIFLPEEMGIVVALGDGVSRYDLKGQLLWTKNLDFKAWTVALSPNNHMIMAGSLGGSIYLLDLDGNEKASSKIGERVHTVRFTHDGNHIIAAMGSDNLIQYNLSLEKIWNFKSPYPFRMIELFPSRDVVALITEHHISLVDMEGSTVYSLIFNERILTCFPAIQQKMLYVSLDNQSVLRFTTVDCKLKAAECYTLAGNKKKAAEIYKVMERYDEAYELFKEIGDFENAASTLHLIGDTRIAARHYEVVGKYEKAARLYEEIDELSLAAKCYGKAGMYKEAAILFEKLSDFILAADFYERAGQYKKAGLLFGKITQFEKAISNLEAHLNEYTKDEEAIFRLGVFYMEVGRFDDAIKMFQQVIENTDFRKESLQRLGKCFLEKKIYDVALDRFFECLADEKKPAKDNIEIFYNIGLTYEQKGEYDEAKKIFGKIMAIDYYYRDIQERLRTSEEMAGISKSKAERQIHEMPELTIRPGELSKTQTPMIRYRIAKKLGEGGMGAVYLAKDTELNREVAWKVLPPTLAGDEEYRKRLLNEARAAAQLSHRNIIAIYDIILTENECSIIMEYIDGKTIRHIINETKKLPLETAIRYGTQIADALSVAHRAGVIHRDLKPENIMISSQYDEVKVVDFGLARLGDEVHMTREGCILGTIPYMAPEQIMAKEIGPHTDIYAFGIVLFEMLAGRTPFIGQNILAQHLQNTPPALREFRQDVPDYLNVLINMCLEKEAGKRPKNCSEIVDILRKNG